MTAHPLPLASPWFTEQQIGDGLSVLTEPHVHSFLRANIWHLRGTDRDLLVDAGLGVASLRQEVPHLFERDPVLVVTHAHLDHMGGAHEFGTCHLHPAEAATTAAVGALRGEAVASALGLRSGAYARPLPHLLMDAAPTPDFDPDTYELRVPANFVPIDDGHVIDLGGRALTALHLPGHSPGGIALYEPHTGVLFSGDVVYDLREGEQLLDGITGANVDDYVRSLTRLADLPVSVVHPGHGPSFGQERLLQLIHAYIDARTRNGRP